MRSKLVLLSQQAVLVVGAALAYFGVRGLTEGAVARADANAERVLRFERTLGIDFEQRLQDMVLDHDVWVTAANWVYIWLHWPVITVTLLWLLFAHRDDYTMLRNAMFISGAIGLVIFATFPVTPPRLLGAEYLDTVTQRSNSYRVLQPPGLVNKYAAVPSLHFGWNLIVGITWWRVGRTRPWRVAAVVMPLAMGWAVVATANHWVFDVIAGGAIALIGFAIERVWARHRRPLAVDLPPLGDTASTAADRTGRATGVTTPMPGGERTSEPVVDQPIRPPTATARSEPAAPRPSATAGLPGS